MLEAVVSMVHELVLVYHRGKTYFRSARHAEDDVFCYTVRISSSIHLKNPLQVQKQDETPLHIQRKKLISLTPVENQSPSGVGVTRDLIASTIDTEVDAAEDLPHFLMRTPPL